MSLAHLARPAFRASPPRVAAVAGFGGPASPREDRPGASPVMPSPAARGSRRPRRGARGCSGAPRRADAGAQSGGFEPSFSGRFGLESRWYPQSSGPFAASATHATGFTAEPTLFLEDEEGKKLHPDPLLSLRRCGLAAYPRRSARGVPAPLRRARRGGMGGTARGRPGLLGGRRALQPGRHREPGRPRRAPGRKDQARPAHGPSHLRRRLGDGGDLRPPLAPRAERFRGATDACARISSWTPTSSRTRAGREERHLDLAARYSHSFGLLASASPYSTARAGSRLCGPPLSARSSARPARRWWTPSPERRS